MHAHLHELPDWARDLIAAQAETISLQSVTLNRITAAMSAQSDATEAALKALTDEAHVAAGVITALRADGVAKDSAIAGLTSQLSAAQASAENADQLKAMAAAASGATSELQDAVSPPQSQPEPQPEPAPEPAPEA